MEVIDNQKQPKVNLKPTEPQNPDYYQHKIKAE